MPIEGTGTRAEDVPGPGSYAALGLGLAAAGCGIASWRWGVGAPAWAGSLAAWGVQTATFWPLWGTLRRGERALHVWIGGIAARVAGLGAATALAWAVGSDVDAVAVAYGLTVMVLLWAEGFWLTRATSGAADDGSSGSRSPPEPIES